MNATVAIVVALIAGFFSLSGIGLQVSEAVRSRKSTNNDNLHNTQIEIEENAAKRLDERYEKYLQRQEQAVDRAEKRAEKAQVDLAALQAKYIEAIERIDALDHKLTRSTEVIQELETRIERLSNS